MDQSKNQEVQRIAKDMLFLLSEYKTDALTKNVAEQLADARLVEHTAQSMRSRLDQARDSGKGGWWNPADRSLEELRAMLKDCFDQGDMLDVVNIAAMIHIRETMEQVIA